VKMATLALQRETRTIPIVIANGADPRRQQKGAGGGSLTALPVADPDGGNLNRSMMGATVLPLQRTDRPAGITVRLVVRYSVAAFAVVAAAILIISPFASTFIEQWSRRDVELRSTLVFNSIRDQLTNLLTLDAAAQINDLFDRLTLDERLHSVAFCDQDGALRYSSNRILQNFSCEKIARTGSASFSTIVAGDRTFIVGAFPVTVGTARGHLTLLHDLTFAAQRAAQARVWIIIALGGVALVVAALAPIIALLMVRRSLQLVRRAIDDARAGDALQKGETLARFEAGEASRYRSHLRRRTGHYLPPAGERAPTSGSNDYAHESPRDRTLAPRRHGRSRRGRSGATAYGASAVRSFMATRSEWTGTASDLLGALAELVGETQRKNKRWPDSARALAGRLRRAATFLRKVGIEVTFGREGRARTRTIRLTAGPESGGARPSTPSALPVSNIAPLRSNGLPADAGRTVASMNAVADARRMVDSYSPTTGRPTEYAKCSRD
jgi:hypothetical protein